MIVVYYLFLFLFLFFCGILCIVILMQESKTTGLGASFGGDTGESLFGTSTPAVLKKFTAYLSAIFLASCIILSLWTGALGRSKMKTQNAQEELQR